jgi:riboflavin transporter FmnP
MSPEAISEDFLFIMDARNYVMLALVIILMVGLIKVYGNFYPHQKYDRTKFVARVGIFSAIAAILYVVPIFQIKLPFLPAFLSLHFDEVPAFIAGFAYGPLAGFAVLVIKTIIKLPFTETLCVGELSDLIFSTAFVVPAAIIYQKKRNLKGVALGFALSTILQLIVSTVLNIYAMLPFYMFVMGFSYEALLSMCQAANPAITSLGWPYGLFAILPLNLIKDAAVIVITFIVYRSIHSLLHFETAK